ncbi:MAG: response regulator [Proteobacteria bacterium]|nr:response regulator [Pseudomonadota bacterium]
MRTKPITELAKPSVLNNSDLFSSISIAVADPDARMAYLVKRVLSTLGCNRIFTTHDGQGIIDLMKEEKIDMIITEWDMQPMNGIDLTYFLRRSVESPNRMVPIIMLTPKNEHADIRVARDAGISEYLIKPFSAKTLMERMHAVVETPRSLIICKNFVGPDRRRSSSLSLPGGLDGSKPFFERKPPLVTPKEELGKLMLDDTPRIILPDYTLKKKIGFEVPSELLVNPLTIAKSEEEIKNVRDDFLTSIMKDVVGMEDDFALLVQSPDNARKLVRSIQTSAERVASRAGVFGYIRATEVATQLHQFCRKHYDKENKYHLIILEKHIQTLSVIFAQNITDDGGQVGGELLRDLARLIQKYLYRKD